MGHIYMDELLILHDQLYKLKNNKLTINKY